MTSYMTDKELNIRLREMARKSGLCDKWYEEWKDDDSIDVCQFASVLFNDFDAENLLSKGLSSVLPKVDQIASFAEEVYEGRERKDDVEQPVCAVCQFGKFVFDSWEEDAYDQADKRDIDCKRPQSPPETGI